MRKINIVNIMLDFLRNLFGGPDLKPVLERGAVILDVRTPAEFAKGSVEGARNIPLPDLSKNMEEIKKMKKPIIAICASGMRSGAAVKQLELYRVEAYNGGSWKKMKEKM